MKATRRLAGTMLLMLGLAACSDDELPTVPRPKNLELTRVAGDTQFALPGTGLADSLRVRVTHRVSGRPVAGVEVVWHSVHGDATPSPRFSVTGADGIATTHVELGAELGVRTLEATFDGLWGVAPRFTAIGTHRPEIDAIHPELARTGDTLTISGRHFYTPRPELNLVRIAGRRARVIAAAETELRALLPACLATRRVEVTAALGPVVSAPAALDVAAEPVEPLELEIGGSLRLSDEEADRCLRMPVRQGGSAYLMLPQNLIQQPERLSFQLVGVSDAGMLPAQIAQPAPTPAYATPAAAFKERLRQRQAEALRELKPEDFEQLEGSSLLQSASTAPPLGHLRRFTVVNIELQPVQIDARLRAAGAHVLIYVDEGAPAGGFTDTDLQVLAQRFDDPIYTTLVEIFGEPSDIDGNGRVIVLLTGEVNKLTKPEDSGYIAGFFNACDLLPGVALNCPGNGGEIFYGLVPDPSGVLSRPHDSEQVLRTLHSVLAHELQHMIHFNQRTLILGAWQDELWLMEGLAHTAEELVAEVFLARGDPATANMLLEANRRRGRLYLRSPEATTLLATRGFGTLEERGAGWLFVSYLRGRFGSAILGKLTRTTATGVANVDAATELTLAELLSDWGVALAVDGAPELVGRTVEPRFSFPHLDLRALLSAPDDDGAYALQPLPVSGDFLLDGASAHASGSYILIEENGLGLNVALAGGGGAPFPAGARRQLTVFRLR
jgi:hypothetical protein